MYELGNVFDDVDVPEGSNVLIAGPPMTGKRRLGMEILAHGSDRGEGAIVVTTKDNADGVIEEFDDLVTTEEPLLGVVDCVTRQQGMETSQDEEFVRYASSPVDITGIGMELSELLRDFYQDQGVAKNRVLLHSVSTLLMYSDLQTVFRFLHVFTGRIQSADGLGLFVIDETAHDEQTISTIKQLFDGVVEIEEVDGERRTRLVGVGNGNTEWRSF